MSEESVTAHAPGSVTVLFRPAPDGDGSHGVSFTTEDGVTASLRPAATTAITLDGSETEFEPVAGVLDRLGVTARVALDAATPVGAGFGASGAATLATALAADELFDLDHDRSELVGFAHRAEAAAGTGLGDVFVQARGGLVYDVGDGRARHARRDDIQYVSHSGIETEQVLGDESTMERVRTAAAAGFESFAPTAPLGDLFDHSRVFAEQTGLVTDRVRDTLDEVAAVGGSGTMAMVGETVIATGAESVLPNATRVTPTAARVIDSVER
ncbi:MAG: GHMP kinase [Halobaculum sp.]